MPMRPVPLDFEFFSRGIIEAAVLGWRVAINGNAEKLKY